MTSTAAMNEPIVNDITIYQGTDNVWFFRRVTDTGTPIIPSSAKAQVRYAPDKELWADFDVTIDPVTGWMKLVILEAVTITEEWYGRCTGSWDLEVILDGLKYRWVMGAATVSHEVTQSV